MSGAAGPTGVERCEQVLELVGDRAEAIVSASVWVVEADA
jgi:hypothetical protein